MADHLAFVFPGQGSQSIGMLAELAESHSNIQATFAEASDALGYDLWKLVANGPEEELNQTHITQPAMLAAGVAVWRVWSESISVRPSVLSGHSLGEYTALVCANSMQFADAIRLVEKRGKFMQEAVPAGNGLMAAILGLDDAAMSSVCADAAQGQVVQAVNYNAPGQIVIAGDKAAVERACELAKAAGAKRAMPLSVSAPSHCDLMQPAGERLAHALASINIQMPDIPVLHNVDVTQANSVAELRDKLVAQVQKPVQWVNTVNALSARGITTVIECGPGKVLAGLNKRIDKTLVQLPIFDTASLEKALAELGE